MTSLTLNFFLRKNKLADFFSIFGYHLGSRSFIEKIDEMNEEKEKKAHGTLVKIGPMGVPRTRTAWSQIKTKPCQIQSVDLF